jgi:hypothetical protein
VVVRVEENGDDDDVNDDHDLDITTVIRMPIVIMMMMMVEMWSIGLKRMAMMVMIIPITTILI